MLNYSSVMKTMDDLRNLFLEALQQETNYLQKELPHHLYAIINGYLQGGGKRLRPCLLLMCAQAAGGDVEKALPAAVAVEEFHTWTLIHDDVIDHDDFRRGNPTGHILGCRLGKEAWKLSDTVAADYGVSAAILAGDSLQARATEKLFELKDFQPQTIMSLVSNMTGLLTQDLLAGEQLDVEMSHMSWNDVTEDTVMTMINGKTGALLKYCAEAGAALGMDTPIEACPTALQLGQFARNCGIAFQLQDDILGIYGEEAKLGKPIGSDIREGKRTLLACRALAMLSETDAAKLRSILGRADITQNDITAVRNLMNGKPLESVQNDAESYVQTALSCLEMALPASSPCRDALHDFAMKMTKRVM